MNANFAKTETQVNWVRHLSFDRFEVLFVIIFGSREVLSEGGNDADLLLYRENKMC